MPKERYLLKVLKRLDAIDGKGDERLRRDMSNEEIRLLRSELDSLRMECAALKEQVNRLLEGAVILNAYSKYSYEQVSEIVEHQYLVFRYKMSDGKIYDGYFPCDGEPETIDVIPGTHASSSF